MDKPHGIKRSDFIQAISIFINRDNRYFDFKKYLDVDNPEDLLYKYCDDKSVEKLIQRINLDFDYSGKFCQF